MSDNDYLRRRIEEAQQRKKDVAELAQLFSLNFSHLIPEVPDERQFFVWLRRHPKSIIADSFDRAGQWFNDKSQEAETNGEVWDKTFADVLRYVSGVMLKKQAEADRG